MLTLLLAAIVLGSAVYSILTIVAARAWLDVRPLPLADPQPVSVLKPLSGAEPQLEQNLRSFFEQDYGRFELLFAVRSADDPAVRVVEKLREEYPMVPARTLITGEPPYPNAKVFSLYRMTAEAHFDLLVMSDSDIRVEPHFLRVMAAEFQDPKLGLSTCPYRAVPGGSFWSTLEALGMNTQFLGGVLTARLLEGMKFALGPTIAARRAVLEQMGGFDRLKDYLAEDFVMGKFADELGHRVILSSYVIEHHIGNNDFRSDWKHRLRWCRSTRRSRPSGYLGELFTIPVPPALALLLWDPAWWGLAVGGLVLRGLSAWACAGWVLHDRLTATRWFLLPLQDLLAFAAWLGGFMGRTILWRGRRYLLRADGKFELVR